jgi:hypothetical protein
MEVRHNGRIAKVERQERRFRSYAVPDWRLPRNFQAKALTS